MTALTSSSTVAVVGAGTMGQGIAQVAVVAGHPVRLYDSAPERARQAAEAVGARLDRLVEKGRMTPAARDAARARLEPVDTVGELAPAVLVVEAIVELLPAKRELFAALEDVVAEDCLLATNTSSLPVTAVAGGARHPGRFVGMHFFNPAPLLPLVEVVRGSATSAAAVDAAHDTAAAWGKTPVRCADTPGFVVNRIARPFYAEAFRVHEEGAAAPATVDAVLRGSGGFAMGPFELTDLIGQDVNEAVTRSVWEAFFHSPRFTPSLAQRRLVQAGLLGRKSGRGWFSYGSRGGVEAGGPEPHTVPQVPAPDSVTLHGRLAGPAAGLPGLLERAGVSVRTAAPEAVDGQLLLPSGAALALTDGRSADDAALARAAAGHPARRRVHFDLALDYGTAQRVALAAGADADERDVLEAVGLFQALGARVSVVEDVPGMIVARTVAMIVDFAVDAAARGVATPEDIDTAMRLGVNYPEGPFTWADKLGADWLCGVLEGMRASYADDRYAPSRALRRRARRPAGVL